MDPQKIILGKKVLIVDDEKDILDVLTELLELCKIDTASSFEEAKDFLDRYDYDIVVLDIMGVKGFDLLEIAKQKGIPALMELTRIGKACHTKCAISHQVGTCIMPREGVFARVIRGGRINADATVRINDAG